MEIITKCNWVKSQHSIPSDVMAVVNPLEIKVEADDAIPFLFLSCLWGSGLPSCAHVGARDNAQMELPLETHETFKQVWATYRDGQRTMCEAIASYVEQTGHIGLAGRIRNKFIGSRK